MKKSKNCFINLVSAREKHGLTQADVAKLFNVSTRAYSHYENGEREMPISYWKILAKRYNTTIDELSKTYKEVES